MNKIERASAISRHQVSVQSSIIHLSLPLTESTGNKKIVRGRKESDKKVMATAVSVLFHLPATLICHVFTGQI